MSAYHSRMKSGTSGRAIDLNHAPVDDNENADGDCPGADSHEQGLKPQPQQRPHIHFHEPAFQIRDHGGNIDAGVSDHHSGSAVDNALGSVEDAHTALQRIEHRERAYLWYRFGFEDDIYHPLNETAKHFHLSESRAKSTEALALDNVWLELPWWY